MRKILVLSLILSLCFFVGQGFAVSNFDKLKKHLDNISDSTKNIRKSQKFYQKSCIIESTKSKLCDPDGLHFELLHSLNFIEPQIKQAKATALITKKTYNALEEKWNYLKQTTSKLQRELNHLKNQCKAQK